MRAIAKMSLRTLVILTSVLTCSAAVIVLAQSLAPTLTSSVFDWASIPAKTTSSGSVRKVFQAPTAMLEELECHVTTLDPGQDPHPAHRHPEEELYIIKEGTVDVLIDGEHRQVGAGSVIFAAAHQLHGIRNAGPNPAVYHVIKWRAPGTPTPQPQP